jgi:hypothetical protein
VWDREPFQLGGDGAFRPLTPIDPRLWLGLLMALIVVMRGCS